MKARLSMNPARLACTGKTAGPSLYHLLGRDKALGRIEQAIGQIAA